MLILFLEIYTTILSSCKAKTSTAYAVNKRADFWRKTKIAPAIFSLQFSPLQQHLTCKILLKFISFSISAKLPIVKNNFITVYHKIYCSVTIQPYAMQAADLLANK